MLFAHQRTILTASASASAARSLDKFLDVLGPRQSPAAADGFHDETQGKVAPFSTNNFISTPFTVNYAGRCVPGVPYNHPDSPKLQVLMSLVTHKFLHREIREKGGAYGGGASLGANLLRFYSYRDPGTTTTLQAFDAAGHWAAGGSFTDRDIDEAKLAVFQKIDEPVPPPSHGLNFFQTGITPEMRQARREGLLAVSRQDVVEVAEQ